ncbi:MAG: hypothetical protein KF856_18020 [Cyclobacteriaceae bacterium]|nr:hypothetical protein [Cyclobacteriaceae bacterium]
MVIERTKNKVVITLPGNVDMDLLQQFVDLVQFKSIVKKSKASSQQIETLIKQAKKGRWARTKANLK